MPNLTPYPDTLGYILSFSFPEEIKLLERMDATLNPTLLHFYRGCRNVDPDERHELRLMRVQGTYSLGKYLQNLSGLSKNVPLSAVSSVDSGDLICLFDDTATLCVEKEKVGDKDKEKERERDVGEEDLIRSSPCIDLTQRSNSHNSTYSSSNSKDGNGSKNSEQLEGSRKRTIESISTSAGQQSIESKGAQLSPAVTLSAALTEDLVPALLAVWAPLKEFMLCFQSRVLLSNDVMSNNRYSYFLHIVLINLVYMCYPS